MKKTKQRLKLAKQTVRVLPPQELPPVVGAAPLTDLANQLKRSAGAGCG